eukprot:278092_1
MASVFRRCCRRSSSSSLLLRKNNNRIYGHEQYFNHNIATSVHDIDIQNAEWHIIDSTLREGLQFCNAFFDSAEKREIASRVSDFGIEYIELLNPCVSSSAFDDIKSIVDMSLSSKILTHVRCNIEDVDRALQTGVDGIDIVIGTSSYLR